MDYVKNDGHVEQYFWNDQMLKVKGTRPHLLLLCLSRVASTFTSMFNDMSFKLWQNGLDQPPGCVGHCLLLAVCFIQDLVKLWVCVNGPSTACYRHFPNSNVNLQTLRQIAIAWAHPIFRHVQIPRPSHRLGWSIWTPKARAGKKTQRKRRSEDPTEGFHEGVLKIEGYKGKPH